MSALICLDNLINTLQIHLFNYASVSSRYSLIESDYIIPITKLHDIRNAFINDMIIGLTEDDHLPQSQKKSSLKMLSSHITTVPKGTEEGVFYTLDWGGTNYRVVRIEFSGKKGQHPVTTEFKTAIPKKYQNCGSSTELFDHLATHVKNKLTKDKELNTDIYNSPKTKYRVGFTFSFPMAQPALDEGILSEWTKGFDVPDVVGEDVAKLMHESFDKHGINAQIHAVCNDTVGTLLATAYHFDNVRVGLILGTGSNASYIEPQSPYRSAFSLLDYDDEKDMDMDMDMEAESRQEIINIEWGNFDKVPRGEIDLIMNEYTLNPARQFAEKIISGYYLGEMVRLLAIKVFGDCVITIDKWEFKSETVSAVLQCYYDNEMGNILDILNSSMGIVLGDNSEVEIFGKICALITQRSADLAACLLLGTLQKTGLYTCEKNNVFKLNDEYECAIGKMVTVGIDGSVFKYVPKYKERMIQCMNKMVGKEIASRVQLVLASDGSGKGAALAVAASLLTI